MILLDDFFRHFRIILRKNEDRVEWEVRDLTSTEGKLRYSGSSYAEIDSLREAKFCVNNYWSNQQGLENF